MAFRTVSKECDMFSAWQASLFFYQLREGVLNDIIRDVSASLCRRQGVFHLNL